MADSSYKTKESFLKGSFEHDVTVFDSFGRGNQSYAQPSRWSTADGYCTSSLGVASHSDGISSIATADYGFTWNGVSDVSYQTVDGYAEGLYCINTKDGAEGFFIGNDDLKTIIESYNQEVNDLLASDNVWSGENTYANAVELSSKNGNPASRVGTFFRNGATVLAYAEGRNVPKVTLSSAEYFLVPTFQRSVATASTTNAANCQYVYSSLLQDIINPNGSRTALIATLSQDVDEKPQRIATCGYVDSKFPTATKNRDDYVPGRTKLYDTPYRMFDGDYYQKKVQDYTVQDMQNKGAWRLTDGCVTQGAISLAISGQHIHSSYRPDLQGECLVDKAIKNINEMPVAAYAKMGKMKLYQSEGGNTDGTMSQKAILTSFSIPIATEEKRGILKLAGQPLVYDTYSQTYGPTELYSDEIAMTQRAITNSVHVPDSSLASSTHEPLSSTRGTMFKYGGIVYDETDARKGCIDAGAIYNQLRFHGATKTDVGVLRLYDSLDDITDEDEKAAFTQRFISDVYHPLAVPDSGQSGLVKLTNDYADKDSNLDSAMTKSSIIEFFNAEVAKPAKVNDTAGILKLYSQVPLDPKDAHADGGATQKAISDLVSSIGKHAIVDIDHKGEHVYPWGYVYDKSGTKFNVLDVHWCLRTILTYADGKKEIFGQFSVENQIGTESGVKIRIPLGTTIGQPDLILITLQEPTDTPTMAMGYGCETDGIVEVNGEKCLSANVHSNSLFHYRVIER